MGNKNSAALCKPESLHVTVRHGVSVMDSREVAMFVEKRHDHLIRDIRKYINTLNKALCGEISLPNFGGTNADSYKPTEYFLEQNYTDDQGKTRPRFDCTRKGCDLIAHKLNSTKGVLFTAAYVSRFYEMENRLREKQSPDWQSLREASKPVRRTLTDAIRDSGEDERMHGKAFAAYTNLVYLIITGKQAKKLKEERGAPKGAKAADFLSTSELAQYTVLVNKITVLLDVGMTYSEIKSRIMGRKSHVKIA